MTYFRQPYGIQPRIEKISRLEMISLLLVGAGRFGLKKFALYFFVRTMLVFYFCTFLISVEVSAHQVLFNLKADEKSSLVTDYQYSEVLDQRLKNPR